MYKTISANKLFEMIKERNLQSRDIEVQFWLASSNTESLVTIQNNEKYIVTQRWHFLIQDIGKILNK